MNGKRAKLLRMIANYDMKEERRQNRTIFDPVLKKSVRHWGREYRGRRLSPTGKPGVTLFCAYVPRIRYKQWKKKVKNRK